MSKIKRNERIGLIVKVLSEHPNKVIAFKHFTDMFEAAKSSISEDIAIVKSIMDKNRLGRVVTIPGAAGGVKYIPRVESSYKMEILTRLCDEIKRPERIIPGGFLYIADLLYNPELIKGVAEIFAEAFSSHDVDYVVTIETKGIPMAFMTANYLNVPLVIVRKDNKVTDGPTVSINYVSGSSQKLGTMFAPKRAIKAKSNVLIIDDFMKGGGTAKGMVDLVKEFESNVVGIGVLLESSTPKEKLLTNYHALLHLKHVSPENIDISPNLEVVESLKLEL
ncbi:MULTISPECIES: pur operon repressor [unclassified Fusibacter]|uniref:pur operon repressor n=1 Tax=unclassified Fusibacter TaxID=2624464 RepID=UPI0010125CDE|nr:MULTISPECIES: pur operon repressor [unclassified Fusibacter]MCK8059475.1 pur operon repressor [Fusibacter sp. A2]NPE21061.1 pur operon repressor [Fusibacter sp. A1]RXV62335.1 pur operon repressor [Fusibacter sp. A1]